MNNLKRNLLKLRQDFEILAKELLPAMIKQYEEVLEETVLGKL